MLSVYGYQAYNHYHEGQSLYIHAPDPALSTAENLLRMVIVAGAAVPSALAGILLFFLCRNLALVMALISAATLIMNLAVTVLILVCCQGMMNGKEL